MNIAMILEMAADALGDRLAYGTRADGLSYEGLRAAARGIADRVDGSGAERLALMEPNAPIVPATLFGAAWAGVSYAPLNYRLPENQLEALLGRIEPAVVSAPHWIDNKGTSDRAFPDSPDAPAVLLFTSGTSAEPKAAILEHDQLLAYIFNTLEFASAGEDEAAIVVVPPFHVAGVAAVLSNTYVGRRIVPVPGVRFSAEDWLVTARDEGVTHAMLVPTMLGKIVEAMEADETLRVPTLRALSYGGAKMHPSILRRALRALPRGRLRQRVRPHRDQQHRRHPRPRRPPPRPLQRRAPVHGPARVGRPAGARHRVPYRRRAGRRARSRRARRDPHQGRPGERQVRGHRFEGRRRRLAPHRRPRLARHRGLRLLRGPRRRHHHPWRREHRSRRSRRRACSSTTPSRWQPWSGSPTSSTARRSRR